MATPNQQGRRLEDYLDGYFVRQLKEGKPLELPPRTYILLSGSSKTGQANDTRGEQGPHGAFSKALIEELQQSGGDISYRELLSRARIKVQKTIDNQLPEMYVLGEGNYNRLFLSRHTLADDVLKYSVYYHEGTWRVEVGLLEELQTGMSFRESPIKIWLGDRVVGTASCEKIGLGYCELDLNFEADPKEIYHTQLDFTRNTHLEVFLSGDAQRVSDWEEWVFAKGNPGFTFSEDRGSKYQLEVSPNGLLIRSGERLIRTINGTDRERCYQDALETLQHIALWENISEFDNPYSVTSTDEVKISLEQTDQKKSTPTTSGQSMTLEASEAGKSNSLMLKIDGGDRQFHYAVLLLQSNYSISSLRTGDYDGKKEKIEFILPLREAGTYFFKVLFGPEPINARLLDLTALELGKVLTFDEEVTR